MLLALDTEDGNVAVARLAGPLDVIAAQEVREWFRATVKEGHRHLVADLAKVQHVDSSGLAALISGLRFARLAGGDLRIARAAEETRHMLRLTTLERVLRPYTTIEEAVASYGFGTSTSLRAVPAQEPVSGLVTSLINRFGVAAPEASSPAAEPTPGQTEAQMVSNALHEVFQRLRQSSEAAESSAESMGADPEISPRPATILPFPTPAIADTQPESLDDEVRHLSRIVGDLTREGPFTSPTVRALPLASHPAPTARPPLALVTLVQPIDPNNAAAEDEEDLRFY